MRKNDLTLIVLIVLIASVTLWNSGYTPTIFWHQPNQSEYIYSTYFGGSKSDQIRDIILDSEENLIIVGGTYSPDFPIKNAFQPLYGNEDSSEELWFTEEAWYWQMGDAFVTKINPEHKIEWSTYLGGSRNDIANQVLVDKDDNIIVFGQTISTDFPVTDLTSLSDMENGDCFITKFTPEGQLIASTYYAGSEIRTIKDAECTHEGNIVIVGETDSESYQCTDDALQTDLRGKKDGYVRVISDDLLTIIYSSLIGGDSEDGINKLTIDPSGKINIVGYTQSSDLPVTDNTKWLNLSGERDGLIARIDDNYHFELISYFGGSNKDDVFGVTADQDGKMSLVGRIWIFNDQNELEVKGYLSTLDSAGELVKSNYFGINDWDSLINIDTDEQQRLIISGFVLSDGFETVKPFQPNFHGESDIAVIIQDETPMLFSYLGGISAEHPFGQWVENSKIYLVGTTASEDFPVTTGAIQSKYNGNEDGFIWIIDYVRYLGI